VSLLIDKGGVAWHAWAVSSSYPVGVVERVLCPRHMSVGFGKNRKMTHSSTRL